MNLIRHLLGTVRRPVARSRSWQPVRDVLRWPVLFDIAAFLLQARDLRRVARIRDDYSVDDPHHKKVQDYNATVTQSKQITTTRRAEIYYEALTLAMPDIAEQKLLIVGPRNVQELFLAWLYGFSWRNIHAIDLYSTNPKIRVMNMEAMSFSDGSFDAVTMAHTLPYAKDTRTALSEVARVLRPGGYFAFSATYDPGSERWSEDRVSGSAIKGMLDELGMTVFFYTANDKTNVEGRRMTSHRFAVRKVDPEVSSLDALKL